MLGVLIYEGETSHHCEGETNGDLQYLAAFSGTVGGCSIVDGFVPPIYNLTDPNGYYKKMEAERT